MTLCEEKIQLFGEHGVCDSVCVCVCAVRGTPICPGMPPALSLSHIMTHRNVLFKVGEFCPGLSAQHIGD